MLLRFFLLMVCMVLLTGCPRSTDVHTTSSKTMHVPAQKGQQQRHVAPFTRVFVKGMLNVKLHTGATHPRIILKGDMRDLAAVTSNVRNNELRVEMGKGYPHFGSVEVDIYTRYLNALEYHGVGTITGTLNTSLFELLLDNQGNTHLQGRIGLRKLIIQGKGSTDITGITSPALAIRFSGQSNVKLTGVANVTALEVLDNSRLSLYWIKSRELFLRGRGKAFIQLAGVVDKLHVELWGKAHFNGRYLRALRAFIKTHDESVAEVAVVKRQHTLATGASDIRFYNIPTLKADFMADEGAVLDMRDLSPPVVQEYTPYNK